MNNELIVRTPFRRCLYRGLAILLGLLPFVLAEIGLRLAGIGTPELASDPFVEFASARPLFELDSMQDRYTISSARHPYFKPDSFAAEKSPTGFRIFCLGGSTVQGNPYSIETSFPTWLKLSLQAADPSRDWEVVNCGGISYASYRLEPILRECLRFQPDLVILYVGDNEFLEDRSFSHRKQSAAWWTNVVGIAARSHLFNFFRQEWIAHVDHSPNGSPSRTSLNSEVDALLDYQGGLAQYHRDESWRRGVQEHFRFALSSMLAHAKAAKIPVLIVDPVSNIKDCPPFKIEFDSALDETTQQHLTKLLADADVAEPEQKIRLLIEASTLDEGHAGVHYALGRAYLAANRDVEAKRSLFRAKDVDVCPLRMTEPLREIQYAVSREFAVPVVPVLAEFCRRSPHGIPGDEFMLDHVHPTISGQQLIGELLVTQMVQSGWVKPREGWEQQREQAFADHLATLDAPYYARGQEHLEGLRKWAHGRVTKMRTTDK